MERRRRSCSFSTRPAPLSLHADEDAGSVPSASGRQHARCGAQHPPQPHPAPAGGHFSNGRACTAATADLVLRRGTSSGGTESADSPGVRLPFEWALAAPLAPPNVAVAVTATSGPAFGGGAAAAASTAAGAAGAWVRSWRRCLERGPEGWALGGGGGGGRAMLLASLTTSAAATAAAGATPGGPMGAARARGGAGGNGAAGVSIGGGGSGGGGGAASGELLRRGFNLPQLSIMTLPGSDGFMAEQALCEELMDFHLTKNGGYPRPCPRCNSADFMTRPSDGGGGDGGGGSANAGGGGGGGEGGRRGVVEWSSRPLACDACGAWVHLRCAGVALVEQAPPRPWFHCAACRATHLRLEAAAQRNPHPCPLPLHAASASTPALAPRGPLVLYMMTPADHGALAAGGRPRGPAGAVLPLLAQGYSRDAVEGFGQPAREYDGGKYSAVLVAPGGTPVAAATFNVWGSDAQLCLLSTAEAVRQCGHGSALVSGLEARLAAAGVRRLLAQPRGEVPLQLLTGGWGFGLVPPAELGGLHARLPLSYYDCPLLEKYLMPLAEADPVAGAGAGKRAAGT